MSGNPELKKRVTTGIIGGAFLLLLLIFGGRIGIALLTVALTFLMLFEYVEMVFTLPDKSEKRQVLIGSAWLISFVSFMMPRVEFELLLMLFLGLFCYYLYTAQRYKGLDQLEAFRTHFIELVYSIFGAIYLIFIPAFLPLIYESPSGVRWTILFLLIVFSNDTGAYFTGLKYGKKKLYPVISPKKTVEGSMGGLATGVVIAGLFKLLFFRGMPWGAVFMTPLLVGVSSQLGDLSESFMKRAFGKKDSGDLLPGHGGILDRFDGVLFGLPVMYACVRIFN